MKLRFWFFGSLMLMLLAQACKKIPASAFNYDYFDAKSKLIYQENGEDRRVDAIIRMQRDSIVWISLRGGPGIEGARLYATVDSFFMLNRLQKEFYAYSFKELSEELQIPINIGVLQAVLVGNPMPLPASSITNSFREEGVKVVQQQIDNLEVTSKIFLENRKVKSIKIRDMQKNNQVMLEFDEFKAVGYRLLPYRAAAAIEYATDTTKNTRFSFDYQRIQIPTEPLNFPFTITNKFKQVYFMFGK